MDTLGHSDLLPTQVSHGTYTIMEPMNLNQLTGLPLLAPNADAEFGYTTYLQGMHAGYSGEQHTAAAPVPVVHSNSVASFSESSPTPTGIGTINAGRRVPRLERRGHLKSRRGCFNCKGRRIKVDSRDRRRPRAQAKAETSSTRTDRTASVKKPGPRAATA